MNRRGRTDRHISISPPHGTLPCQKKNTPGRGACVFQQHEIAEIGGWLDSGTGHTKLSKVRDGLIIDFTTATFLSYGYDGHKIYLDHRLFRARANKIAFSGRSLYQIRLHQTQAWTAKLYMFLLSKRYIWIISRSNSE